MRQDLLHAQAAVDWAVAQLPTLEKRIDAWLESCPYTIFTEFDPQRGKDAVKVRIDNPLPLIINAETGAIVNSTRSSLDLLATALAKRNGHTVTKDVYFPISASDVEFATSGLEKVKRLSAADVTTIKNLKPYKGGDDRLYVLHQMDILRKHQRLIDAHVNLSRITFSGVGLNAEFPETWVPFKDQAVLLWANPDATECKFRIEPAVTISPIPGLPRKPALTMLRDFASLAESIIKLFA